MSSSSVTCIEAKRCVLEQKFLLAAYTKSYEESIGTKMNDLAVRLLVVVSTIASYSPLNISETVRDRGLD